MLTLLSNWLMGKIRAQLVQIDDDNRDCGCGFCCRRCFEARRNREALEEAYVGGLDYQLKLIQKLRLWSVYQISDRNGKFVCIVQYSELFEMNINNKFWSQLTGPEQAYFNDVKRFFEFEIEKQLS